MDMTYRLTDIIDLDYLINLDDESSNKEALTSYLHRDRNIYQKIKEEKQSESDLLRAWFKIRKDQYLNETDKPIPPVLPGKQFSILYGWMTLLMVVFGCCAGFILAGTFLVYHGSQPINVTVFFFLFVVLPLLFSLLSLIGIVVQGFGKNKVSKGSLLFIFQTLVEGFCFDVLPRVYKKWKGVAFDLQPWFTKMKTREYKPLFFWPFFILTGLFAAMFSAGVLGATFFKVLVSDMAFGWQSTLITSASTVHDLVTAISLPWSFILPNGFSCPDLEQVEGSRIILKEGISVLSTVDLVSWWPFLCMSILVYALIPRVCFVWFGQVAMQRRVKQFEFYGPEFRQVIMRMTSPVVDIEPSESNYVNLNSDQKLTVQAIKTHPSENTIASGSKGLKQKEKIDPGFSHKKAMVLASIKVYPEVILETVKKNIEQVYGVQVGQAHDWVLNTAHSKDIFSQISLDETDPVIVVYEAWQPPIRGLLHSISHIRKMLPKTISLWILLTNDADQADVSLDENDEQYNVWLKAIQSLNDPMIVVKRLVHQ